MVAKRSGCILFQAQSERKRNNPVAPVCLHLCEVALASRSHGCQVTGRSANGSALGVCAAGRSAGQHCSFESVGQVNPQPQCVYHVGQYLISRVLWWCMASKLHCVEHCVGRIMETCEQLAAESCGAWLAPHAYEDQVRHDLRVVRVRRVCRSMRYAFDYNRQIR